MCLLPSDHTARDGAKEGVKIDLAGELPHSSTSSSSSEDDDLDFEVSASGEHAFSPVPQIYCPLWRESCSHAAAASFAHGSLSGIAIKPFYTVLKSMTQCAQLLLNRRQCLLASS